ncbi:DUF5105 domain-containing protein [Sporolactobacillus sp. Y61]|uniref:DUF5105 domain-containing protein n=1 Tax=Sporolactobacillus sp. Y61 TaxID=3160863 RepID=A0AAU8IFZ2_9BACL
MKRNWRLIAIKNRVSLLIFSLVLVLFVAGCGKDENGKGSSDVASVKVKNGLYITHEGQENTKESALLALNLTVTNHMGETLELYPGDFTLFDSDETKVPAEETIYDDSGKFKVMDSADLPDGKSASGYIAFRIDKSKSYELHYQPSVFDPDKKAEPVIVKISGKDYKDQQKDILDAASAYLNVVFFGKQETNYAKLVANDAKKEEEQIRDLFTENADFGEDISPSETEAAWQAFKKTNGEKGKIDLNVQTAFAETAEVEVTPTVLNFNDMYDAVQDLRDQFIDDNRGKYPDYNTAQKAWNKYLIKHIADVFNNSDVKESDESYPIKLIKDGTRWRIDSEKRTENYEFESLSEVMTGGY